MRTCSPADWLATLGRLSADGYRYLDVLTGIDRRDEIEIVAHLVDPHTRAHQLVSTRVPADAAGLDSATGLFPAADWHERETAEMLGVTFIGHPDPRPLLLRGAVDRPPLRKSTPLTARLETPWPGADPGGTASGRSRRRESVPGVLDDWLPGERT